jgi:hypothetical protein
VRIQDARIVQQAYSNAKLPARPYTICRCIDAKSSSEQSRILIIMAIRQPRKKRSNPPPRQDPDAMQPPEPKSSKSHNDRTNNPQARQFEPYKGDIIRAHIVVNGEFGNYSYCILCTVSAYDLWLDYKAITANLNKVEMIVEGPERTIYELLHRIVNFYPPVKIFNYQIDFSEATGEFHDPTHQYKPTSNEDFTLADFKKLYK